MNNRIRVRKNILWIALVVMWPGGAVFAQSQSQSSQQSSQQSSSQTQAQPQQKEDSATEAAKKAQKDKPKPKKVYTEEDLSSMHGGGVSVVGDETPAGAAGTKQANGGTKADVAPMSGQDEGYWRGKARGLLDQIAATDQQIGKTKEEIKKYGGDGFDATSGLKDNIIYIDNRNAKVQQLEKRKADLEKKLDQLQEEGRKAGAEPAWFR